MISYIAEKVMAEHQVWAERTFGACELGDARRTRRLIDLAARLSRKMGASVACMFQLRPTR
ncbi:transposase DNA-binding-containing protein [Xanthomonas citri]|uniref:IS4/Tn5 family transposase DNA-binding protein n=1 Tax=Xanthomonas citri TaxID=346 RepID=UPI0009B66024